MWSRRRGVPASTHKRRTAAKTLLVTG
jgi:hypothetical protein